MFEASRVLEESKEAGVHQDFSPQDTINIEENTSSKLLAWSSWQSNIINIADFKTGQLYSSFQGAQLINTARYKWSHVKNIPDTKLLVSLFQSCHEAVNMKIFDLSIRCRARKIYSFGEMHGTFGPGDITFNVRRNILGAVSVSQKIAYHLMKIEYANQSKSNYAVKLVRKSKWNPLSHALNNNWIAGMDFDPSGESIATIDSHGMCLISDVTTNHCNFNLKIGFLSKDEIARCRWSLNAGEPLLYVKHDKNRLNVIDTEKKALILKDSILLDSKFTCWIDVCPINASLLAVGGQEGNIKIYDRRESKIINALKIHADCVDCIPSFHCVHCVRWSPSGDLLATVTLDATARLFEFKTGKIIYSATSPKSEHGMSVCFL